MEQLGYHMSTSSVFFFFSSRRRHTRLQGDWSSDVCSSDLALEVRLLIAFRDYHSTTHRNDALDPRVQVAPGLATVAPYAGLPALYCAHDADAIDITGYWYNNFEYAVERERGLDFVEDLFSPFALRFDLSHRT